MDLQFCRAMCFAIRRGFEKVEIGRKVDKRPLSPTYFTREPVISGAVSPAALCVDVANYTGTRLGRAEG